MDEEEAINLLNSLQGDDENAHAEADSILLQFLAANDNEELAEAFLIARERCDFLYA